MAGIGFEIRKTLKKKTILSLFKAYSYSAIVSSGPWIISMLSIFVSGYIVNNIVKDDKLTLQFTIIITYLIALSMIITSFTQLAFTRYLADRIFENKNHLVLPTTLTAIALNMIIGAVAALPYAISLYEKHSLSSALSFEFAFIFLSGVWIGNIVLSGLKNYKFITFAYFVSYLLVVGLIYYNGKDLDHLLFDFFISQGILLILLITIIAKNYYSDKLISFDFLKKENLYIDLIFIGFFMTIAVWVDKFTFWYTPSTSKEVIGLFRYSPIYDLPIFLAYLTIAPGIAMFLLRVETEFVEEYYKYYNAVRNGGTLREIYHYGNEMIDSAKYALIEVLRVQILSTFAFMMFAHAIFNYFHMPTVYLPIFYVDLIGVALQLFFMSISVILFYLDKRKSVLVLSIFLFLSNFVLSIITTHLGIFYYGYGFSIAYLMASILAILYLNKIFRRLHYETFMYS